MAQSSSLRGLNVISNPNYIEYRYYGNKGQNNQHDDDPGHSTNSYRYARLDVLAVGLISYACYRSRDSSWHLLVTVGLFIAYVFWRCSRIIYESVTVFPPHGIQLETHRGPFGSLYVSRRFIPVVYIQDIIINEALRRWNVRYYLAAIVDSPGQNIELVVAFQNTLPHFPVLIEVYHGIIKALYKE